MIFEDVRRMNEDNTHKKKNLTKTIIISTRDIINTNVTVNGLTCLILIYLSYTHSSLYLCDDDLSLFFSCND